MKVISKADFVESIALGFQYISHYHPPDFIKALHQAYNREKSGEAKNAIAQILINSKMAAEGKRPLCQDTGLAIVFVKVGMGVTWDSDVPLESMVNLGIRQAYMNASNPLRASIVTFPLGQRANTGDNTPGVIHTQIVVGDEVEVHLTAKGFGSENKARLLMLNPHDDVVAAVVDQVQEMGAGWCPPGMLGIGIGGSAEKAMLLAKESLLDPVDIHQLLDRSPENDAEKLRLDLYHAINQTGIGAQGLGGLTTVLDVKVKQYPTHAGALPVGIIPNCAATRHIGFRLTGKGPAVFPVPKLDDWPEIALEQGENAIKVDLSQVDRNSVKQWKAGQTLYLTGKILTARDAAHKRISDILSTGGSLPDGLNLKDRLLYYVGPVPGSDSEVVGPAGPTTSNRMDKYSQLMLKRCEVLGMIGKAERGNSTIDTIRETGSVYLIAVGGAAYLISKSITSARVVAFEDLGMEAVYEFEVAEMPVIVAVDTEGASIHKSGPERWRKEISASNTTQD